MNPFLYKQLQTLSLTPLAAVLMISQEHKVPRLGNSLEMRGIRVGAFGDRLRREREMRGVSLEEIAAATKIGTRLLRALEDEQFERLPGGIFNKGFIRAYAKYLGIDEEGAVADYLDAAGRADPEAQGTAAQNVMRGLASPNFDSFTHAQRSSFPFIPVLVLIVVIAGGLGGWRLYRDRVRDHRTASTGATDGQGAIASINKSGRLAPRRSRPGHHRLQSTASRQRSSLALPRIKLIMRRLRRPQARLL